LQNASQSRRGPGRGCPGLFSRNGNETVLQAARRLASECKIPYTALMLHLVENQGGKCEKCSCASVTSVPTGRKKKWKKRGFDVLEWIDLCKFYSLG
jgi:hypothetical protein